MSIYLPVTFTYPVLLKLAELACLSRPTQKRVHELRTSPLSPPTHNQEPYDTLLSDTMAL